MLADDIVTNQKSLIENVMHILELMIQTDRVLINKKRTFYLMEFAIPVDHKVKMKENER